VDHAELILDTNRLLREFLELEAKQEEQSRQAMESLRKNRDHTARSVAMPDFGSMDARVEELRESEAKFRQELLAEMAEQRRLLAAILEKVSQ